MIRYLKLQINLSILTRLVLANNMQGQCLTEWPAVGTPEGTYFSDKESLTKIDDEHRLYGYYECNDEAGSL